VSLRCVLHLAIDSTGIEESLGRGSVQFMVSFDKSPRHERN
jgi:hypothetical protein